ncbi:dysbindin-A-like [Nerophis ophidion]|uniref:dysbindin-A-like n=1 Tax=Nerophis ophidion TaxID=159077 RepID=UPI002ADF61A5|nr:dysbindin-A-like [Nerophis ophidion]
MFENLRERLHLVQQDFTTGLKTLGDKTKESKSRRKSRFEETFPLFTAGQQILGRYEESWFVLHKTTKDCGHTAQVVDGEVVMLSVHWEKRRSALTQLQEQLHSLPDFICQLDAITTSIAHLEGDFEEMESRLVHLETLCGLCEQHTSKLYHVDQLDLFKKKKRRELEALEAELQTEHVQKVAALEQTRQQRLKQRQKIYEEAFHQDLEQYRATGCIQSREATDTSGCGLDHMTLTNLSDQEALDHFLDSADESLPVLGAPAHLHKDSEAEDEAASEEDEGVEVQSDEDDVQPLVGLQDVVEVGRSSDDESDTASA